MFVGPSREEQLQLPAVQNLLRQSKFAKYGFSLDYNRYSRSNRGISDEATGGQ